MILGGLCFLYVGAAQPAPPCRLFVQKSTCCGELGQTMARLSYYQHTQWSGGMRLRFGGPVVWRGGGGGVDGALVYNMAFPEWVSWDLGGGGVGTRAHLDWDHVAKQLDFFHGAAGK